MLYMQLGTLNFTKIDTQTTLAPEVVLRSIEDNKLDDVYIAAIDPSLADTAAFCEAYGIALNASANCVIVEAKRAEKTWYAVCVVLATDRADINGVVRKQLDARKVSFASMESATQLTSMEYGGITPIGLPADWPIIIDSRVAESDKVIIGSGIRGSKILVTGALLATLPNTTVLDCVKV